jgi:outer membrane protein OmpA-like peptidoglycan-associated protein
MNVVAWRVVVALWPHHEGKDMFPTKSILFAGVVLTTSMAMSLVVTPPVKSWAQQPDQQPKAGEQKKDEHRPGGQNKPGQAQAPQGQPPAVQDQSRRPPQPTVGQKPNQPQSPAAQGSPAPTTAQDQQKDQFKRQQPPAAQTQPPSGTAPTAQQPNQKPPQNLGQRPGPPPPPSAQGTPAPTAPTTAQDQQKDQFKRQQQPPAAQTQPPSGIAPTAQQPPKQAPTLSQQPTPTQPPAAAQSQPPTPSVQQTARPGALPPPTNQVRQSQEFIRPQGQQPTQAITSLRQERREVREGDRVFIQEPDRTIIREGNLTIIRHSEVDRFTVGARNVRNEHRGNETISVVERSDGSRIETIVDADGRLIRRSRRDPSGREIVIIDNSWAPPRPTASFVVELPLPVISIPRERYIVEVDRVGEPEIYAALTAPPIERITRRYSLDEVRYSPMLRDRMPRVDLDTITFDTGSWQIGPEQIDKLAVMASALRRAIDRNPREVFLIEGHTDAVGTDVDNLSLSDRRAETVAVVLTEQFHVPAENLSTQGYGSQFLKIPTMEAERQNRRVAVRRITPLLDPDQRVGG